MVRPALRARRRALVAATGVALFASAAFDGFPAPFPASTAGAASPKGARSAGNRGRSKQQAISDEEFIEREKEKLTKALERKIPKKEDGFFVVALAEITYHTSVEWTAPPELVAVNGRLYQHQATHFRYARRGEFFPVIDAKFRIIEGRKAAVDAVFDHLAKYIRPPSKRPRPSVSPQPPLPEGNWQFVGRFKNRKAAENAQAEEQAIYEAEPRWIVPGQGQSSPSAVKAKQRP